MKLHSYLMTEAFRAGDGPACYAILQEHFGIKLPDLVPVVVAMSEAQPEIYACADGFIYFWTPVRSFRRYGRGSAV